MGRTTLNFIQTRFSFVHSSFWSSWIVIWNCGNKAQYLSQFVCIVFVLIFLPTKSEITNTKTSFVSTDHNCGFNNTFLLYKRCQMKRNYQHVLSRHLYLYFCIYSNFFPLLRLIRVPYRSNIHILDIKLDVMPIFMPKLAWFVESNWTLAQWKHKISLTTCYNYKSYKNGKTRDNHVLKMMTTVVSDLNMTVLLFSTIYYSIYKINLNKTNLKILFLFFCRASLSLSLNKIDKSR